MAKTSNTYRCSNCGATFAKWSGQCAECGAWNALTESIDIPAAPAARTGYAGSRSAITALGAIKTSDADRHQIGISELDRVLGGGLVPGAALLVGGDPGIGKSTLLLQVCAQLHRQWSCLYATGEESLAQLALRAKRLQLDADDLPAIAETQVEAIISAAQAQQPKLIVIDSIQTLFTAELTAAPGSVSQVRESAARLVRYAKLTDTAIVMVGHVTKEGGIAGPRVLEHMVDAVLYFEGEPGSRYRMMRALKNRFGAANELGVFAMTDLGLKAVSNPSAIFLSAELDAPGSAVLVTREGTRPLLLEVQALVDTAQGGYPKRVAQGLDGARLNMLLAVLHRSAGIQVGDQDVYVNVVGGVKVTETAADLAIAAAIVASLRGRTIPRSTAFFGEIGLTGEVRPVPNGEERLSEAARQGFERIIHPLANRANKTPPGVKCHGIRRLRELLDLL